MDRRRVLQLATTAGLDTGAAWVAAAEVDETRAIEPTGLDEALARAADGAFAIAGDGKVVVWNRAAEKILGYSAREVIGRPAAICSWATTTVAIASATAGKKARSESGSAHRRLEAVASATRHRMLGPAADAQAVRYAHGAPVARDRRATEPRPVRGRP